MRPFLRFLIVIFTIAWIFPQVSFAALTDGLIAHYTFDETSGTVAGDTSGNNNFGTLNNGPVSVLGKLGRALSFDGIDDYVSIPGSSLFDFGTTQDLSVSGVFGPISRGKVNSLR